MWRTRVLRGADTKALDALIANNIPVDTAGDRAYRIPAVIRTDPEAARYLQQRFGSRKTTAKDAGGAVLGGNYAAYTARRRALWDVVAQLRRAKAVGPKMYTVVLAYCNRMNHRAGFAARVMEFAAEDRVLPSQEMNVELIRSVSGSDGGVEALLRVLRSVFEAETALTPGVTYAILSSLASWGYRLELFTAARVLCHQVLPSAIPYTCLLSGCVQASEASEILAEMQERKIGLGPGHHVNVLTACARHGETDAALRFFADVPHEHLQPSHVERMAHVFQSAGFPALIPAVVAYGSAVGLPVSEPMFLQMVSTHLAAGDRAAVFWVYSRYPEFHDSWPLHAELMSLCALTGDTVLADMLWDARPSSSPRDRKVSLSHVVRYREVYLMARLLADPAGRGRRPKRRRRHASNAARRKARGTPSPACSGATGRSAEAGGGQPPPGGEGGGAEFGVAVDAEGARGAASPACSGAAGRSADAGGSQPPPGGEGGGAEFGVAVDAEGGRGGAGGPDSAPSGGYGVSEAAMRMVLESLSDRRDGGSPTAGLETEGATQDLPPVPAVSGCFGSSTLTIATDNACKEVVGSRLSPQIIAAYQAQNTTTIGATRASDGSTLSPVPPRPTAGESGATSADWACGCGLGEKPRVGSAWRLMRAAAAEHSVGKTGFAFLKAAADASVALRGFGATGVSRALRRVREEAPLAARAGRRDRASLGDVHAIELDRRLVVAAALGGNLPLLAELVGAQISGGQDPGATAPDPHLAEADLAGVQISGGQDPTATHHLAEADLAGAQISGGQDPSATLHSAEADLAGAQISEDQDPGAIAPGHHSADADVAGARISEDQDPSATLHSAEADLAGSQVSGGQDPSATAPGHHSVEAGLAGTQISGDQDPSATSPGEAGPPLATNEASVPAADRAAASGPAEGEAARSPGDFACGEAELVSRDLSSPAAFSVFVRRAATLPARPGPGQRSDRLLPFVLPAVIAVCAAPGTAPQARRWAAGFVRDRARSVGSWLLLGSLAARAAPSEDVSLEDGFLAASAGSAGPAGVAPRLPAPGAVRDNAGSLTELLDDMLLAVDRLQRGESDETVTRHEVDGVFARCLEAAWLTETGGPWSNGNERGIDNERDDGGGESTQGDLRVAKRDSGTAREHTKTS
ncbi:hypothetical protein DIPPA_34494 [Diplonema papillatum]|nr:hypothetical protein DIPPA_34494 [Diplonema papillatum]